PDCGGLARSVGAQQAEHLAAMHVEIERIDRHVVPESLGEADGADRAVRHGWTSRSGMRTVTGRPGLKRSDGGSIATRTPNSRSARSSGVSATRVTNSACGLIAMIRPEPGPEPRALPSPSDGAEGSAAAALLS